MNTVKVFILSLIGLVVFVFGSEAVLRILRLPHVLIYDQMKALTECWKETHEYDKNYNYNKLRLRGKKEILPKQDNVYRIVCVGDSWTFGLNVEEDKTYPAILEDLLRKNKPGMKIEVINAGTAGYSLEEVGRFLEKNLDVLTPDCIIFWGGISGITVSTRGETDDNRYINFYRSRVGLFLSKSHFYNAVADVVDLILSNTKYFNPEQHKKAQRERTVIAFCTDLLDRLQKEGKTVILLNYPLPKRTTGILYEGYEDKYYPRCHGALKVLLKKNPNFIFIDLFDVFRKIDNRKDLFLKMYYQHPSAEGYKIIADSIGDYLLKELPFGKK